jgi:prenylcysteine oxidase / farnesylcysteine lyase
MDTQNVDHIHALEGLCSMATNSASGIKGGNFKIFEQFLEHSGANVHLNTAVSYTQLLLLLPSF